MKQNKARPSWDFTGFFMHSDALLCPTQPSQEGIKTTSSMADLSRGLYIKTYGCQMNVYDSQRMEEALKPLGFFLVEDPQEAQVAILNGCQIREKSEEKLFSDLGRLRLAKLSRKKHNASTIIIVAGCVGQALGGQILKRAPYVDVIVGPQTYHTLPETITKALREVEPQKVHLALGFPKMEKFDELPGIQGLKGPTAFLSIQEGCNKFCRYCVVPFTRGPEYSRAPEAIMDEAKRLVDLGAKEITLLGQNVNAFHGKDHQGKEWTLGRLLVELAEKVPQIKRLRYTTSHPRDVNDDLIHAHRDVPAVMPFLHLPVQSGSDRILARMNRQYTSAFYRDIIDRFRKARPDMGFSSDFIVGYPDEQEEDFQGTLDLVEQIHFAQAYSFKYSPRQGTPAAMVKQIEEKIKDERLQILQRKLTEQRKAYNNQFLGETLDVLIEPVYGGEEGALLKRKKQNPGQNAQHAPQEDLECAQGGQPLDQGGVQDDGAGAREKGGGRLIGKSPYMQTVHARIDEKEVLPAVGDVVRVKIDTSLTNSLIGDVVR